jgi:hypothetical protein
MKPMRQGDLLISPKRRLIEEPSSFAIAILGVALIATFYGDNVQAFSSKKALEENRSDLPTKIAQVSPLYGCWQLTFRNALGAVHKSTLVMNGYRGIMRTSFWNVLSSQTETIDQTMRLASSASGILIAGSNPVWAGTSRRHANYSPDSFLFSIQPNGRFTAATCDDNLQCSPVKIRGCR